MSEVAPVNWRDELFDSFVCGFGLALGILSVLLPLACVVALFGGCR